MLKKRDDFEDILEERRRSSDLRYALRCYTPALHKGVEPCKASALKSMVLRSDQVHHVISQVRGLQAVRLVGRDGCGQKTLTGVEIHPLFSPSLVLRTWFGLIQVFSDSPGFQRDWQDHRRSPGGGIGHPGGDGSLSAAQHRSILRLHAQQDLQNLI